MKAYREKPFHVEIANKVVGEGLLEHWPEGREVRVLRTVVE